MIRRASTAALLAAAVLGAGVSAPTLRGEIVFSGSDLSEDFDSLGTTAIVNHWSGTVGVQTAAPGSTGFDGTKIAGSSGGASLGVSDGGGSAGAIYSFGAASGGTQSDRALGAVASGTNTMAFGFALRNNAPGTIITSITISFTQENWRTPTMASNTLTAAWGTSATPGVTTSNYLTAAGLSAVSDLNMTLGFTSSNTVLDGNLLANQVAKSFVFSSLSLAVGDRLFVRWQDVDNTGNDAGIGMDDMSLSFTVTMVPEAPAGLLGAVVCGSAAVGYGVGWLRRRRA